MQLDSVRHIAVIGAGTMGHSIAEVAAVAGFRVSLSDIGAEQLQKGMAAISWSLRKLAEKGTIPAPKAQEAEARIRSLQSLQEAVKDADVVIEVVRERLHIKRDLFATLDRLTPKHAILLSNTSSLSITEIGRATSRPGQVAGMHFFTPPIIVPMVEVVKGRDTSEETMTFALALAEKFGKKPLRVNKDVPSFIVNRSMLGPYLTEPARIVSRGEATVQQIDGWMKVRENFPFGPFELLDFIGSDIFYDVLTEEGTSIPAVIEQKVQKRELGRKTGKGFYDYAAGKRNAAVVPTVPFDPLPLYAIMANEAAWLVENEVTTADQIDLASRVAAGFPEGIIRRANRIGLEKILQCLDQLHAKYGDKQYRAVELLRRSASARENNNFLGQQ